MCYLEKSSSPKSSGDLFPRLVIWKIEGIFYETQIFKGWNLLEVFGLLHHINPNLPGFWLRNTGLPTSYW